MEETLKQGQRTIHYISATKCLYFATKLQKQIYYNWQNAPSSLFGIF